MRAFIAIELPKEIKGFLSGIQDNLKIELSKLLSSEILAHNTKTLASRIKMGNGHEGINWTKPQNLHLTLKFLGDISFEQLAQVKEIIAGISKMPSRFKIKLDTLGVFPDAHAPRIIWIGADQPPLELKEFEEILETRLSDSGIPLQRRHFCAHITIGRIRSCLSPSDLKKTLDKIENDIINASREFECGKVTLFESALGPSGPTYTALERFKIT
ncbi:MAG: RNA 2',3'-cyclic phosphodiesterase [Candidatus Omnitrophica bacterium]|nr:RNA 2',3'-cyclic phosphodiesterase [Candidatus Omnitrophota bacterium]MDD5690127.1 RNA 2',3'-cyclic phosphodiesterase [Candidatus Omnitrophota bacterium]